MKRKTVMISALAGLLAVTVSACGGSSTASTTTAPAAQATATGQQAQPSPTPIVLPTVQISLGISGVGEVKAEQDADLVFQVQGTVAEVRVEEGQTVKKGDVLATLDPRTFDAQVKQAEAALQSAQASLAGLNDAPKRADIAAANAAIAQANATLQKTIAGVNTKQKDIQNAQAAYTAAQANLQNTRDKLSQTKSQAESTLQLNTEALTAAQATYSKAKSNWDYVQESGKDPATAGQEKQPSITDVGRENYYAAFVQAEAALRQSEELVRISQVNAEQARQAEITGLASAEQTLEQSRIAVERNQLPSDPNDINVSRAGVAVAVANRNKLNPAPTNSQQVQAESSIAQANANLETARVNRERTELTAPFDGVISTVNIDPGDPSSQSGAGNAAVIQIVDISKLHIDVQVSDIDIGKVTVGQAADIHVDALSEQAFSGKVSYIAPTATVSGNVRTYLVRVIPDKLDGLRVGLSTRVELKPKE